MPLLFEHSVLDVQETGNIILVQNNILHCSGLPSVGYGEIVLIGELRIKAQIAALLEDTVLLSVLEHYTQIKPGDIVYRTFKSAQIPVGSALLGRIIDPLGGVIDGGPDLQVDEYYPVYRSAPQIMDRLPVNRSAATGIKFVDILIPIAKGQRELILGDRKTGKTSLATNAAIAQMKGGSKCVYVIIGKERWFIQKIRKTFESHGVTNQVTIVVASSEQTPALKVMAPFSGCAIAEYWMDRGEDVIIIYDDLSQHAIAHRQVNLSLRYAPGREAYPGDLFFLHARLLERAACVNSEYIKLMSGTLAPSGSITALPILQTQYGDITSFVATNLISITDGQIVLSGDLFKSGIRPAVNIGLSVSRIGGAAQNKTIKQLSADIKITLSQYKELESFSSISSELDTISQHKIDKGKRTIAILGQDVEEIALPEEIAMTLMIINFNAFVNISIKDMKAFEKFVHKSIKTYHIHLYNILQLKQILSSDQLKTFEKIINECSMIFITSEELK